MDDVGAGYSSLQSVAELHPDFLKIDRSLISGVNNNPIKWALLETFVSFSKRSGCQVIAEGVETLEEFQTVIQLGVDYVQGYFVGKPTFNRLPINEVVNELLNKHHRSKFGTNKVIGSLIEPAPVFVVKTPITTVDQYFRCNPSQRFIVVTEGDKVVGLLDREKTYATLGSRYGVSLYSGRSIKTIMNNKPLVVEDTTPIEVVLTLAIERGDAQMYDCVVVMSQHRFLGLVPVSSLIKAMAEQQIQIAQGTNPLSGLPGNHKIDQELRERLSEVSNFGVIYADLNQFKQYNDVYGFAFGDIAIKLLADLLKSKFVKAESEDFVGHIGGDDFIIITTPEQVESHCLSIISDFQRERNSLLGGDVLSIALAGLEVNTTAIPTPLKLGEEVAKIKKEAKSLGRDNFVIKYCEAKKLTKN